MHFDIVSFCMNHHPLCKEAYLIRFESFINLWAYRYEFMNLEDSLILCSFSRIIVGWPLKPVSFSNMVFWSDLKNQGCISSCETGFKSNWKSDYPHNTWTTILTMHLSCHAGPYWFMGHSWVRLFSPPTQQSHLPALWEQAIREEMS